jgi:hypothetical protein
MASLEKKNNKLIKLVKTLCYNSALEIIHNKRTSTDTKYKDHYTGKDKKTNKEWDTLDNRIEDRKKKEFASPCSITPQAAIHISNLIEENKIPKIQQTKLLEIRKLATREFGIDDKINKLVNNGKDAIDFIKSISWIMATIALNSHPKKFTLSHMVLTSLIEIIREY